MVFLNGGFSMNYTFLQRLGLTYLVTIGIQVLAVPHIQQIRVTQQVGNSCGYHAAYNATAVDTLAWQGRQLTSAAIVQEARQYRDFIQGDALFDYAIIHIANQEGTVNLYCVNGHNGLAFAGSSNGSQDGNQFLRDVVMQRDHAHPMIGHFVVNTGWHWVTFSVVKRPGQEVTIVYMDSMNTPLARNRVAQAVGNTLLTRLGGVAQRVDASGSRGPQRSGRARDFAGRSARNAVNSARGFRGNNRRTDNKVRQPEFDQEQNYTPAYDEDDISIQATRKDTGFSYKTYLAVGLVCFLIGLRGR